MCPQCLSVIVPTSRSYQTPRRLLAAANGRRSEGCWMHLHVRKAVLPASLLEQITLLSDEGHPKTV